MSPDDALIVEPLGKHHDRAPFSCGVRQLDRYLGRQASQDVRRRIARVFVAVRETAPQRILGFYTLSALAIAAAELPPEMARKLPKHPMPAALIGRLAVDVAAQGTGIGKMLLMDAIHRALAVAKDIAVFAMVVDAKDENARRFYEGFGFIPLAETPTRLFLPLSSVVG
jgi:GNAT superfamily N-acetyltransferase